VKIRHIDFLPKFYKRWDQLPRDIQVKAQKKIELFQANPFHPSLRLHPLHGKLRKHWSISVDMKYRIILDIDEDVAIFYSIGTHAIYEKR